MKARAVGGGALRLSGTKSLRDVEHDASEYTGRGERCKTVRMAEKVPAMAHPLRVTR